MARKKCTHEGTLWQPPEGTAPTSLQGNLPLLHLLICLDPHTELLPFHQSLPAGCLQPVTAPGRSSLTPVSSCASAWLQLLLSSPSSCLPSFHSCHLGVLLQRLSPPTPVSVLFIIHRRVPKKSLACLIPSWHQLLEGPKLTQTLWNVQENVSRRLSQWMYRERFPVCPFIIALPTLPHRDTVHPPRILL